MAVTEPMLVTIPASIKRDFDFRAPHDFVDQSYSPPISRHYSSPPTEHRPIHYQSRKSPAEAAGVIVSHSQMTSNLQHSRNLPPPPPLSLPDPRNLPPSGPHSASQPLPTPLGSLPPPPPQWQGHEDYMRTWLLTKAEEEKRKQEEERSRQEQYRLEQRKLEYSMLQDGIRAGVPGAFIPILCLAITGGANLANTAGVPEVIQQYLANVTGGYKAPPPAGPSPEAARNTPGPVQQPAFGTAAAPPPTSQAQGQVGFPPYSGAASSTPRTSYSGSSGQRGQTFDMLPRLATAPTSLVPGTAGASNQAAESPIYFHHWTPPTSQSGAPSTTNSAPAPPTPLGE
jgi:hypothetical protein